ncbi:MAG: hypothetical protein ACE5J9_04815, partial [Methanosarcinales archaeon]
MKKPRKKIAIAVLMILALATLTSANPMVYMDNLLHTKVPYIISYQDSLHYTATDGNITKTGTLNEGEYVKVTGLANQVTIDLSSELGYVYTIDDSFTSTSDDSMVLARGRNGLVDTDFYVYNPVPSAYVARLIITALQDGTTVDINDTTDDSDDVFGIKLNKGEFHSEPLSGESMLHVTSNNPVFMYFGYLDDNNWEIMPSVTGDLVGKEYYVPTPCYVGVMPLENGNIEITRVKDSATVYSGSMTKGNAIITKTNAGPCSGKTGNGWDGANMLYINSTQPVYAWIMDWYRYLSDDSFIPAVSDSNNMEFYGYASDDYSMDARVWVFAFEDSTTVTVTDLTDGDDSTTGILNKGEHLIAGNPFDNDNFKVVSNKPVTVKIEGYAS